MMWDDMRHPHVATIGHGVFDGVFLHGPSFRRDHFPNSTNGVRCEAEGLQDDSVKKGIATPLNRGLFLSGRIASIRFLVSAREGRRHSINGILGRGFEKKEDGLSGGNGWGGSEG
jgi:hypothetical protein